MFKSIPEKERFKKYRQEKAERLRLVKEAEEREQRIRDAAPEMLAALKSIDLHLSTIANPLKGTQTHSAIKAAIDKAEGRTE